MVSTRSSSSLPSTSIATLAEFHFACSVPRPNRAKHSILIFWPGASFTIGIPSEVGATSGSSDARLLDRTVTLFVSGALESSTSITRQLVQSSLLPHEQLVGSANRARSVFSGTSPSLCASPSSGSTEVLVIMSTLSIANIGTPLRQIRRKAFAYCSGTPFILTDILRSSLLTTLRVDKSYLVNQSPNKNLDAECS